MGRHYCFCPWIGPKTQLLSVENGEGWACPVSKIKRKISLLVSHPPSFRPFQIGNWLRIPFFSGLTFLGLMSTCPLHSLHACYFSCLGLHSLRLHLLSISVLYLLLSLTLSLLTSYNHLPLPSLGLRWAKLPSDLFILNTLKTAR